MMAHEPIRVIVFLPPTAATFVARNLEHGGYRVTMVRTVSELHEAICLSDHVLAVTTRGNIDIVRHMRQMPVVNIEVFLDFPDGQQGGSPRRFDAKAFIARVAMLTADSQFRAKDAGIETTPSHSRFDRLRRMLGRWVQTAVGRDGRRSAEG